MEAGTHCTHPRNPWPSPKPALCGCRNEVPTPHPAVAGSQMGLTVLEFVGWKVPVNFNACLGLVAVYSVQNTFIVLPVVNITP